MTARDPDASGLDPVLQRGQISRRSLLIASAALVAAPLGALAQQPGRKPARICLLGSGAEKTSALYFEALKQGLRDNGLIEGKDHILEARWAEGQYDRFPPFAAEFVRSGCDVMLVTTIAAARAAQGATTTMPIVMTGLSDPVGMRLVASLARPGGNTTGLSVITEDVTPKLIEFLRIIVPDAKSLVAFGNPANPANVALFESIRAQAAPLGVNAIWLGFKPLADLDATLTEVARQRPHALLVMPDSALNDLRYRIAPLAIRHRLLTITNIPEYTDAGALIGYGPSRSDNYRRSANYVKKILDGAKPSDLPVEMPTHIELSVNLKTARALGITVPPSLLLRADRVIE